MSQPGTSTMTSQRIERLLRSLVGVSDLRLDWNAHALRGVHILRDARVQPHQLIRNVVSGLHAGIGVVVLPTQVHVHDDVDVFEAIAVAAEVLRPAAPRPVELVPANGGRASGANGNGETHAKDAAAKPAPVHAPQANTGRSPGSHLPVARPISRELSAELMNARASRANDALPAAAELIRERQERVDIQEGLQLERIDIERRGATLRCRTVLSLNGRTYSAIAEVPDAPAAEAELAARVAVDALRAGGLTEATLDGVGFITISDVNYCVTTVREPGRTTPRAGAAPMIDSMAASATAAVLTALGTYTDVRARSRARSTT